MNPGMAQKKAIMRPELTLSASLAFCLADVESGSTRSMPDAASTPLAPTVISALNSPHQ